MTVKKYETWAGQGWLWSGDLCCLWLMRGEGQVGEAVLNIPVLGNGLRVFLIPSSHRHVHQMEFLLQQITRM